MKGASLRETLEAALGELRAVLSGVREAEVEAFVGELQAASRVFCAGRGRSELQIRGFAMRLMHLGLHAHVVGETTTPSIGSGDLLVLASGTAATRTLVPITERARGSGARVALLTATPKGVLSGFTDALVRLDAPASRTDPSAPGAPRLPMGSPFELSLAILLEAVVIRLMALRSVTVAEMFGRHANLE